MMPETTEELLSDFYFILFSPNPNRNMVHIIVDDGTVKLYMNIKKFVSLIKQIVNENVSIIVRNCCDSYGGFYLIDRNEASVVKLSIDNEKDVLNLKDLHNDIMAAKESEDNSLIVRQKYIEALTKTTDLEIKKGTKIGQMQNHYSATILYGQDIIKSYRPY